MHERRDDLLYFSAGYLESRARFRAHAKRLQAEGLNLQTESFAVPSAREPDLTVDSLFIPATGDADLLLVLISGVHGMEAYTGTAIQDLFLKEFQARLPRARVSLLVVHAMNPFGFKHHRRTTEGNINLNRNFSLHRDLFQTQNTGYHKLSKFLEPQGKVGRREVTLLRQGAWLGSRLISRTFSLGELIEAVGQGQFESPRGLEYGGRDFEPQTLHLIDLLRRTAKSYKDVVLLDLHTGLGDRYQIHLMPGDRKESVHPALFAQLFRPANDHDIYAHTTGDAAGFYHTHGDLNNLLPDLLSSGQRGVALTIEFGTLGNGPLAKLETLNRMINENQGYHQGYASTAARLGIEHAFAELFYPSEPRWRQNVLSRSRALFERLLVRIGTASRS